MFIPRITVLKEFTKDKFLASMMKPGSLFQNKKNKKILQLSLNFFGQMKYNPYKKMKFSKF